MMERSKQALFKATCFLIFTAESQVGGTNIFGTYAMDIRSRKAQVNIGTA